MELIFTSEYVTERMAEGRYITGEDIKTMLHLAYDHLPANKKSKTFEYDFEFVVSENSYYNYGKYLAFSNNVHLITNKFNFLGINLRTSPTVKDAEVWLKSI